MWAIPQWKTIRYHVILDCSNCRIRICDKSTYFWRRIRQLYVFCLLSSFLLLSLFFSLSSPSHFCSRSLSSSISPFPSLSLFLSLSLFHSLTLPASQKRSQLRRVSSSSSLPMQWWRTSSHLTLPCRSGIYLDYYKPLSSALCTVCYNAHLNTTFLFTRCTASHHTRPSLLAPLLPYHQFSHPSPSPLTSLCTLPSQVVDINSIPAGWMGLDIGPKTLADIQTGLADCKTGENNVMCMMSL